MGYLNTQIDLLTIHLLFGNVVKVKVIGSHNIVANFDSKEKKNYLNNQGVWGTIVRKPKVKTISRIITMITLLIKIMRKGIGSARMIKVGYMSDPKIVIILQINLEGCLGKP